MPSLGLSVLTLAGVLTQALGNPLPNFPPFQAPSNHTVSNGKLQTWWHSTGEINTKTPVQNGNVRQSHAYNIQVAPLLSLRWYDSFVYEAIPRSGNGQIDFPGSTAVDSTIPDGVTIEPAVGINMAWTQFLYAQDVVVKITRKDKGWISPSNIVIRPTTIHYPILTLGNAAYITVPYISRGTKFSVEFQDDLFTYRSPNAGSEQAIYVQNENPAGVNYVPQYNDSMTIVGREPRNALMIFASPFPSADLVPARKSDSTYIVPQGLVTGLDQISHSTIYFPPGVYWFTGTAQAVLNSNTNWVYFAPGSFVKGAIKYTTTKPVMKATGYGVLSGEQYVYQANTAQGFQNIKSDGDSLRMWSGTANTGQRWILNGPTITAAPFNTMDFFGDDGHFTTTVFDYKQVGCFFWQTDGLEIYPGSNITDTFYHAGDDGLKTYYSDVNVERIIIWKTNNDPLIEMGWSSRNISNIALTDISLIHVRYLINDDTVVPALIGEAPNYLDSSSTTDANTNNSVNNFVITNLRCEGVCPSLIRLNPLENFDNFFVNGVYIEEFTPGNTGIEVSFIKKFTDASGKEVTIGANSPNGVGLTIKDFYVGRTKVSLAADNWQSGQLGHLNFDASYWGHWTVV